MFTNHTDPTIYSIKLSPAHGPSTARATVISTNTSLFCLLKLRISSGKFDIDDIDAHLCTHLNYGFANMDNQTWKLVAYDPWSVWYKSPCWCESWCKGLTWPPPMRAVTETTATGTAIGGFKNPHPDFCIPLLSTFCSGSIIWSRGTRNWRPCFQLGAGTQGQECGRRWARC